MPTKTVSKCSSCGYPLTAEYAGQITSCPNCGTINEAISGVNVPTWLFAGGIAFILGVFVGPALISSTKEGSLWLERMARARIAAAASEG